MEHRRQVSSARRYCRRRIGVPVEVRREFAHVHAIHVFRLRSEQGGTLVRSEESWEGFIAGLLKGYSRKTIHRGIEHVLSGLKQEAERRTAA